MENSSADRWILPGLAAFVAVSAAVAYYGMHELSKPSDLIRPQDGAQVVRGRALYEQRCASCHGQNLEGQPNWRIRLANGRMPAPPHDDSGHTWHHPDEVLFGITKHGLVPPYAPQGYPSDMLAFGSILTDDDIRATLAYIESRWSPEVLKLRDEMLR